MDHGTVSTGISIMPPSSITSVSTVSPGLTMVVRGRETRIWDDRTDQRPAALPPARHRQLPHIACLLNGQTLVLVLVSLYSAGESFKCYFHGSQGGRNAISNNWPVDRLPLPGKYRIHGRSEVSFLEWRVPSVLTRSQYPFLIEGSWLQNHVGNHENGNL